MKKIVSTLLLALVFVGNVNAQESNNNQPIQGKPRNAIYFIAPEQGDVISGGKSSLFRDKDGQFGLQRSGSGITVTFYGASQDSWELTFIPPKGQILKRGIYKNAERCYFNSVTKPGLLVSGAGRGCNTVHGEFEVLEIDYNVDGTVSAFAANFVQRCDLGQPLIGTVRFNSSYPVSTFFEEAFATTKDSDISIYITKSNVITEEESSPITLTGKEGNAVFQPLAFGGNGFELLYDSEELGLWAFSFALPRGAIVEANEYPQAQQYPYNNKGKPAISLMTPDGTVSVLEGSFTILEIDTDAQAVDQVKNLALNFTVKSVEGDLFQGVIRFRSKLPALDVSSVEETAANEEEVAGIVEVVADAEAQVEAQVEAKVITLPAPDEVLKAAPLKFEDISV